MFDPDLSHLAGSSTSQKPCPYAQTRSWQMERYLHVFSQTYRYKPMIHSRPLLVTRFPKL
jgi:hypothetical protein